MQCMNSNISQVTLDIQIMVIILRHTTHTSAPVPSPTATNLSETGSKQSIPDLFD